MERVVLLGILPKEADFLTLKLLRTVKENLSFDDNEHKKLKFRSENGMTLWDAKSGEKMKDKDVPIGEIITEEIKKILKDMDKSKKLKEEHITLYEKFIEGNVEDGKGEKDRGKKKGNSKQSK